MAEPTEVDAMCNAVLGLAAKYDGEIKELEKRLVHLQRERGRLVANTERMFAGDRHSGGRASLPADRYALDDGIVAPALATAPGWEPSD